MKSNIEGRTFGHFKVLSRDWSVNDKRQSHWSCLCIQCGETITVDRNYLTRLQKKPTKELSCHCKRRGIDQTGKRYGKLTVLRKEGTNSYGASSYLCLCDCGKEKIILGSSLFNGSTTSCGCFRRKCTGDSRRTHGLSLIGKTDKRYPLWQKAKARAAENNIPFDLSPLDIVIPEKCPLLETPINLKRKKTSPDSPTLDKIRPELGYVKENVWVISHRANLIKNDASVEELKLLTKNLEAKIKESLNV